MCIIYKKRKISHVCQTCFSRYLHGTQLRNAFNFLYVPPGSISVGRFFKELSFFGPQSFEVTETVQGSFRTHQSSSRITVGNFRKLRI